MAAIASGRKRDTRVRDRASGIKVAIYKALRTRAPRRSQRWFGFRRALLRGALGQDGFRLTDFAKKMSVTHTHLNLVLRGKRPSDRIDVAVCVLITYVYGERIGSRYTRTEPRPARWKRAA